MPEMKRMFTSGVRHMLCFSFWCIYAATGYGQQPGSRYCFGNGVVSRCLSFFEGNRFSYEWWSCTGGEKGYGTYTVIGGYLVLTFRGNENMSLTWNVDSLAAGSDSLQWRFVVMDESGEPLPGARLSLHKRGQDTLTDINGMAVLALSADKKSVRIAVDAYTANGYMELPASKNYQIRISVHRDFMQYLDNGTTLRFRIRKKHRDGIELKDEKLGTPFELHKKVPAVAAGYPEAYED